MWSELLARLKSLLTATRPVESRAPGEPGELATTPLPRLPADQPHAPGRVTRLEQEVFRRFPDASHFNHIGVGPTPLGEIDVLTLWDCDNPGTVKVVAYLPRPLAFGLVITSGGGTAEAATGPADLEQRCSIRTTDEAAKQTLLSSAAVRQALLEFFEAGRSARVTAVDLALEVPGVSGMTDTPVARAAARASALALVLSKEALELGLAQKA